MKILVSAYACEPDKGSEPGAGWNWALAAARLHEVWVLTRTNNRDAVESAIARRGDDALHFVYIDLPPWARFWKRGSRGLRLYYVLWQVLAAREGRRLHRRHRFDLAHHVTFANAWLPALGFLPGVPFVLGPVGGGPRVPFAMYGALGVRGALWELVLRFARWVSHVNPLARLGLRNATVILVQNEETRRSLPTRYRGKAMLRPNASIGEEFRAVPRAQRTEPTAIYAGRLVPWKGVSLAVRALCLLPDWRLLIVGSGPEESRLRRLAKSWGVSGRVSFIRWLPQQELWQTLSSCHALVQPSLRDDASFISVEAQALGVPVVAFARGGPAALASFPGASFELVPLETRSQCIRGLAAALERARRAAPQSSIPDFSPAGVARELDSLYPAMVGGRTKPRQAAA